MDGQANVSQIMTRNVVSVFEEDNLHKVAQNLEHFRFRHLPVVDGTRLVGILSQRDLLRNAVGGPERSPALKALEGRLLEQTFVRDVMRVEVSTIAPEDSIAEAARRMLELKVGALPVVTARGELVGIVSQDDILRHVATPV
ncbi:MAG: CBS domain-containing protein [Myxococcales bacterium]